jgi:hypothetical protein
MGGAGCMVGCAAMADAPIVEGSGAILRRSWLAVTACGVVAVLGVLAGLIEASWAPFGWFGVWLGVVLGPIFYLRNAFPRATPTTFRAASAGMILEGHGPLRAEDILEAKLTPRGAEAVVDLALRDGDRVALLTRVEIARALVELLGARRTGFRLVVPYAQRFLGLFALIALVVFALTLALSSLGAAEALFSAFFLAVSAGAFWAVPLAWVVGPFLRGRLVIGADGFTTSWLSRERYVAFRDVKAVQGASRLADARIDDTLVELASGRRLRLRTVEAPNTEAERGTASYAMLQHMSDAFTRSARLLDGRVDVPTLVQRGPRTAEQWLSGLDALVRGGGSGYRVAAVSPEMLAEVTYDPSAKPEARVGAAAALVRVGDEAVRTRVRIAAEGCADTELRETLLALSEARTDTAAVAALARLPLKPP